MAAGRGDTDDLRGRLTEVETLREQYGARGIEEDQPGVFRTLVDLLSRPNYAAAGMVEELLSSKSITAGVGRALSEIFSGIGPIAGQKRAFGEVMERLGVGTVTLADAFPALEGTWVGNFGARGAAGIALDIATDPLTYMTAGTWAAVKVGLKSGTWALSRAGTKRYFALVNQAKAKYGDDVLKAYDEAKALFEPELIDEAGKILAPEYLDKGGLKFFGKTVPGTSGLGRRFGARIVDAANSVPGGEQALKGAAEFGNGFKAMVSGIFHPFNDLANLPPGVRDQAIRLHRKFENSSSAHRARLFGLADDINRQYKRLSKKDKTLGERLYNWREGTGGVLKPEEEALGRQVSELYDSMYKAANDAGILSDDQMRFNYFHHRYENETEDFLQVWAGLQGARAQGSVLAKHTKERVFDTYDDAVETSKLLNKISLDMRKAGRLVPVYPVLKPNYDVMENLGKYIQSHADMIARKTWYEEAGHIFGKRVDDFDMDALYDLTKEIAVSDKERGALKLFFGGSKSIRQMEEEAGTFIDALRGPLVDKRAGLNKVIDDAERVLPKLSEDGRKEFFRQMFIRTKSGSQWADVVGQLGRRWEKYFPEHRAIKPGEIERTLAHYGEEAAYGIRSGSFWGERPIFIPEIIAKDIENINSRLLNTKDYKEFGRLLRGYDKVNNWFKLGVYTFWPASAVRDAYSNIALSMLDIGVGALDPKMHRHALGVMVKRLDNEMVTKNGIRYTYDNLRKMAREFGVDVPGEVFVEATGGGVGLGRTLKKAARARGKIENEARIQLWLNHVNRGMDPRDAAQRVGEFLFNYGEVSQIEREVFRRMIPFYTFTRKNVELQTKMLRRNPGMVINQLKPFRGRQEENEAMVKWEGEALKMRLDRDGKTIHVLNGIDLPLRNVDVLWRGTLQGTFRGMWGMITPVVKSLTEVTAGREFFTNRDLTRARSDSIGRFVEMARTPQPIKNWLGYKRDVDQAGRSRYTFDGERFHLLFKSWLLSRAISTSDRQFREYTKDRNVAGSIVDILTGIRDKELNLDEQTERKLRRRINQLEGSLVRRGVLPGFEVRGKRPQEGQY
jgi:hypothetical protein